MCRQYWTIFFKSSIPVCLSQWLSNFLNHIIFFRFRNRSTSYSDEILPSLCFRNSRTHMMQNNPQLLMSSNSLSHFHWIGPRYLNYRWVAASRPNITIVTFIPAKKKKEKLKQRTDSYIQHRYELRIRSQSYQTIIFPVFQFLMGCFSVCYIWKKMHQL